MKIGFQKVFGVLLVISLWHWIYGDFSIIGSIIFPRVNKVAYPVVCGNGTVKIDSQTHNNYNGGTTTDTSINCVNNIQPEQRQILPIHPTWLPERSTPWQS